MATLDFLPASTYDPPSPVQARMRRRSLNTIIEDDEESLRDSQNGQTPRGRDRSSKIPEWRFAPNVSPKKSNWKTLNLPPKHGDWHSPLSDHFPTPRGNHFMSAPIPQSETSSESNSPATATTAPWTRDSYSTERTDFDDLYDVSDEEEERRKKPEAPRSGQRKLALVIPEGRDKWSGVEAYKQLASPVAPTPTKKVPVSPAIFSFLQAQQVPSSSAPPSLDGSIDSEQMALISAPPTPDIGNDEERDDWASSPNGWGGVQLEPGAMATLQALSGDERNDMFEQQTEQVIELSREDLERVSPVREMQQQLPPLNTNIHRNDSIVLSPSQQRAMGSLTKLEIPSPGGFFSTLSRGARLTWHLVPLTPESPKPPSSSTAEHFYKAPWNSEPVEQFASIPEMSETMSEGLPTARPFLTQQNSDLAVLAGLDKSWSLDDPHREVQASVPVVEEELVADEFLTDYSAGYAEKLQDTAIQNFDRTNLWLAAQSAYLSALINPTEDHDDEVTLLERANSVRSVADDVEPIHKKSEEAESPPRKMVRFSEIVTASGEVACLPKKIGNQESAYYRAFKHYANRARYRDTFIHRIPRFEAMQSQRVSFPSIHRAQLLGKYQLSVVPSSAMQRRMSANVARGDEIAPEDPERLKRDREREALWQMGPATWNVMAVKLLNGGRLIAAPVAKRLARLSSMGPKANGTPRDRARILDLGGQATCDWAWHCASEYPNTKVYTVTTKALRQLSNSNIRGPGNHRQVAVNRLTKLPFKANQFDLVSARDIHSILRERGENGENEWDICLKECMRVLKPGGYLEFTITDSDVVNAGPLGLAKSVEFGFNLKTLGYDPYPTKLWLTRLARTGFVNVKRAWLFLPMGAGVETVVNRNSLGVEVKLELEAMYTGDTKSVASVSGLVGAWAWEKWLLKCRVQTVGDAGSLEGVPDIIEEGRVRGAGWRSVSGWARKPHEK